MQKYMRVWCRRQTNDCLMTSIPKKCNARIHSKGKLIFWKFFRVRSITSVNKLFIESQLLPPSLCVSCATVPRDFLLLSHSLWSSSTMGVECGCHFVSLRCCILIQHHPSRQQQVEKSEKKFNELTGRLDGMVSESEVSLEGGEMKNFPFYLLLFFDISNKFHVDAEPKRVLERVSEFFTMILQSVGCWGGFIVTFKRPWLVHIEHLHCNLETFHRLNLRILFNLSR